MLVKSNSNSGSSNGFAHLSLPVHVVDICSDQFTRPFVSHTFIHRLRVTRFTQFDHPLFDLSFIPRLCVICFIHFYRSIIQVIYPHFLSLHIVFLVFVTYTYTLVSSSIYLFIFVRVTQRRFIQSYPFALSSFNCQLSIVIHQSSIVFIRPIVLLSFVCSLRHCHIQS